MIQVVDEDIFPLHSHRKKIYSEIYEAARQLKRIERGCITVTLGEIDGLTAQKKAHVVFRDDTLWSLKTRAVDGVLWMRKIRKPVKRVVKK